MYKGWLVNEIYAYLFSNDERDQRLTIELVNLRLKMEKEKGEKKNANTD